MKRRFAITVIAIWLLGITILGGTLLTRHSAPLPAPSRLTAELERLRAPTRGQLTVFHVLGAECRCSQQIARELARTRRPDDVQEHVIVVDDASGTMRRTFAGTSFVLHDVKGTELDTRYGALAVPLLLIVGSDGAVRYSGGYTERKQGLVIRDRALIDEVRRGSQPSPLPLFGCAIAEGLRRGRDPLGIP